MKNILSSVHLALAFKNYRNDDLIKSRYHVDRHLNLRKKGSATALAFSATLMLLDKDITSSRLVFLQAAEILKNNDKPDAKYIALYCKYYICLIDECADCENLRLAALSLHTSERIKRWLSLPNKPVPI